MKDEDVAARNATFERDGKAIAVEGHAIWKRDHGFFQAIAGGIHIYKLNHDTPYKDWYTNALTTVWMSAASMRPDNDRLNLEQFRVYTEGYRKIDEETVKCFNSLPR